MGCCAAWRLPQSAHPGYASLGARDAHPDRLCAIRFLIENHDEKTYSDCPDCPHEPFGRKNFDPDFRTHSRGAGPLTPLDDRKIKLHLFVDRSSVEVFGNDGRTVLTTRDLSQRGTPRRGALRRGRRCNTRVSECLETVFHLGKRK